MKCVLCGTTGFAMINGRAKCRGIGCGLVQVSPMPDRREISALYKENVEHFEPYAAQIPVHRAYFRKKMQEIKKRVARYTLLDIGCAMGALLTEAKTMGFTPHGIDISKYQVGYCRKKKLSVSRGTIFSVTKKYDVITAFEVIEHERNPLGMMRKIWSLLPSGGLVVVTTPNHDSFWRKITGKWWVGYRHPEHLVFFDPMSLAFLFKKAGFRDIEIRHDEPRPYPLSFAFTRLADYAPWAGGVLKPIGRYLERYTINNPINPWDDLIVFARK